MGRPAVLPKKKKDGSPFILAERYTWSMSNNAHFYTLAVNLTGAKKEGERFDPRTLLGKFVMVQVTNNESTKNGKAARQPITRELAAGLRPFVEGREPGKPIAKW